MGFLDKDLVDRLLGPKGLALIPPSQPPHVLSPFEARATAVAKATMAAGLSDPVASSLNTGSPFIQVNVPYNKVASALSNGPNLGPTLGGVVPINISGVSVYLRQYGTTPDARFLLDIGGKLQLISPGVRIRGPFTNFNVVKRMFIIPSDVNSNQYDYAAFHGEAVFVVEKEVGYTFEEPALSPQYFRPINMLGQYDRVLGGAIRPLWEGLGVGGTAIDMAKAGARRMLVFISNRPEPTQTPAGTLAAGDVISTLIAEYPLVTYSEIITLAQFPFQKRSPSIPGWTYTWASTDITPIAMDIDLSGVSEYFNFEVDTVPDTRTFYLLAVGVPELS